jgi:hypothetical protein
MQNAGSRRDKPQARHLERLSDEMKAVAQQVPGVKLAAGFFGGCALGVQKQPPVFIVEEGRRATAAGAQQMINRSRLWHWQLAGDAPTETKSYNRSIPLTPLRWTS